MAENKTHHIDRAPSPTAMERAANMAERSALHAWDARLAKTPEAMYAGLERAERQIQAAMLTLNPARASGTDCDVVSISPRVVRPAHFRRDVIEDDFTAP